MDQRELQAQTWANEQLQQMELLTVATVNDWTTVSIDASFRRYFRINSADSSWVVMDAPPEHENCQTFLDVDQRLLGGGLHAPQILAHDLTRGFMLLEDLGDEIYKEKITPDSVDQVFPAVFDVLVNLVEVNCDGLPHYDDARLQQELDLFPDWYLQEHIQQPFTEDEQQIWQQFCSQLARSALNQPQVFVHRDFHSCNLLFQQASTPGVIDFQDAVKGAITYDLISLLWDRYISWPRKQLEQWMEQLRLRMAPEVSPEQWQQWCDWMGLQRNLKVVGIFARLNYRDNKTHYLDLMPRFASYVLDVLPRYAEFEAIQKILKPRLEKAL